MQQYSTTDDYIYNSFWRLMMRSFELDWEWLQTPAIPKKYIFLWKKYIFLILCPTFWDQINQAHKIKLWNQYVYLENREHIGILQSTFIYNAYLNNFTPPDAIIVDIGAHTGEFAVFCDIYLHAKRIYSFEPVSTSYKLLALNKKKNTYHSAIGTNNRISMHIPEHTAMASSIPNSKNYRQEISPCVHLDEVSEIRNLPNIDLLKIDVEGMEYDVLEASKETIKKSRYILIELSINRPSTKSALDTLEYLRSIAPSITLLYVGQVFSDNKRTDSVDLLFKNTI